MEQIATQPLQAEVPGLSSDMAPQGLGVCMIYCSDSQPENDDAHKYTHTHTHTCPYVWIESTHDC